MVAMTTTTRTRPAVKILEDVLDHITNNGDIVRVQWAEGQTDVAIPEDLYEEAVAAIDAKVDWPKALVAEPRWYEDYSMLLMVAQHLVDTNLYGAPSIVHFFEKPYNYTESAREWAESVLADEKDWPPAAIQDARRLLVEISG